MVVVQGVMAINCTVLSLLFGPNRGWCAGKVPLEVICCCVSDGLEMGSEREFTPPITGRSERVTLNASPRTKQLTRTLEPGQPVV